MKKSHLYTFPVLVIGTLWLCCVPLLAWGEYGHALNGTLKYPAGFQRFAYTAKEAAFGGNLQLHAIGSFDKMNPFTLKGEEPYGLETFVFDTLAVQSLDEPFSVYGLIAQDIEIAADGLSVVFTLDGAARFADGSPITVKDVAYSLNTLKGPAVHPLFPYYYRDITRSEIIDTARIRFVFAAANRELPMIAAQMPIFSPRSFPETAAATGSTALVRPIGSGPYLVDRFEQGKYIVYRRNPEYWARNHPTRRGMFNYDAITVKYYKDQVVALEAFKAGEFDVMPVYIAKQWVRDLAGSRFNSGELVKKLFSHQNNAGMQGFLMNTRRPLFQKRPVRQAIGLAFDFEWTNRALFYDQYRRSSSFFSNSYLAANGLPQGLELEYLNEFRNSLPLEVFTVPPTPPVTTGRYGLRKNLLKAMNLLHDAGYTVKNGTLVDGNDQPFSFEITLIEPTFERVMAPFVKNLERLGMRVSYRAVDPTIYTERIKNFDFDMIVVSYGQSLSPGNEQRNFWQSAAADQPGSNNYAGIHDKVVDKLIDKIIYAKNNDELTAACRALDRVLWYGYYLVPNWYMNGYRIAYRDIFAQPMELPLYYSPLQLFLTWWIPPGNDGKE
ncbi:MAG: extracellular solute-binding protein [Desulfopila sp.]